MSRSQTRYTRARYKRNRRYSQCVKTQFDRASRCCPQCKALPRVDETTQANMESGSFRGILRGSGFGATRRVVVLENNVAARSGVIFPRKLHSDCSRLATCIRSKVSHPYTRQRQGFNVGTPRRTPKAHGGDPPELRAGLSSACFSTRYGPVVSLFGDQISRIAPIAPKNIQPGPVVPLF